MQQKNIVEFVVVVSMRCRNVDIERRQNDEQKNRIERYFFVGRGREEDKEEEEGRGHHVQTSLSLSLSLAFSL